MRIGFFLRESLRALRRNAVPSFAALATVLVTVLVLGVFIPVVQVTTGAANDVRKRVIVGVYLKDGVTPAQIAQVGTVLRDTDHVKSVQYVSKASAFAQQKKADPAAYAIVDTNPLPDSFRVTPDNPSNVNLVSAALTKNGKPINPAIETVNNRRDDAQKILSATSLVKATMGILAVLLVIASILLISNTIRLSLFARRREVEVMKLVGATDWFIRWPFVLEGILLGAIGGVLAIGLLLIAKFAVVDSIVSEFSVIGRPNTINFPLLALVLMSCAVAVSAAGSGLSLRRFLRV
ncbi:MAG TPA: permease-like cell division protein FtsX [Solirubrobacteraceae bacterium]|nr:permease-like cell division protein FtsX [Solirubrobacteraceae bacterium]